MERLDYKYHRHHHHDNDHHHSHHHHGGGDSFTDYNEAVAEYRKSFASKQDVIDKTPDPSVKEMIQHFENIGIETIFDRFDSQKPHCTFGIAGICCKNCNMGPCRITKKSPKGACGADADLIVARNLLRWVAAGAAAHGARGRETMLALKYAAEGKLNIPIAGVEKLKKSAVQLGIDIEGKSVNEIGSAVADILLEDLSRTVPSEHKTLKSFAALERIKLWKELDVLPVSAYHEVFEAFHRTSTGTDSDWENIMKQVARCGLAFAWSSVLGSSIAMDSLFGIPERSSVKVNTGAIKKGYVNIAVHGHTPVLVSKIVRIGRSEEFVNIAKEKGASGIQFYGICCSGLSAMYRYGGVIPLSNAVGAELVLGTGALDLWVADVQDVFPSIMDVAKCVKTTVITTSDAGRLPGSEFYGFDHDHSNIGKAEELAKKIIHRAIESYEKRREVPVHIPQYEVTAEIGFSVEFAASKFGGIGNIAESLKSGKIRGVVNLVGCNNPRVIYEKAVADIAEKLIANDVLVLTNGCASFPLLKLGYCSPSAIEKSGEGLKEFLSPHNLPPVWHMGECLDNARASALFKGLADNLKHDIKDLPYSFASPEWSNEKGVGAALGFRLLGINSYHCVYPPVQGSENVSNYLYRDTKEIFGSVMVVNTNPNELADKIISDIEEKRKELGWR